MTQTTLAPEGAFTLKPRLTAADRCDVCGARAHLRAILRAGDLFFCAHHGRQHIFKLSEVALDMQDFTELVPIR
jgi:hypothetical protein